MYCTFWKMCSRAKISQDGCELTTNNCQKDAANWNNKILTRGGPGSTLVRRRALTIEDPGGTLVRPTTPETKN